MRRIKKYKALSPVVTVKNISDILFNKLGIRLKVKEYAEEDSLFFSSRVDVETDELKGFAIGTNGKGLTREYSLASAHAEFMERIQNGLLFHHRYFATAKYANGWGSRNSEYVSFLKGQGLLLKYAFAPDEIFITDANAIESVINKYVCSFDNNEQISEAVKNGITLLPFYNVIDKKVEMLPITIIHNNIGSNGMCAGNNAKEAIIQGLSEIVERYVLRLIYQKNLTLPSIPKEEFIDNDIYSRILALEAKNNISIDIKDCSCGYGIPAVGVLIREKETGKYQFRIGVDPSPVTALERSLSELFQGRSNMLFFNIDVEYQTKLLYDAELKEREFRFSFLGGIGQYPISLFYETPSYEYKGYNSLLSSDDDYDLNFMLNTINNMGFSIYVRDVSFLGFPSYRIYIPGMSEIDNVFSNKHFRETYNKNGSLYAFVTSHNISAATNEDIKQLLHYIDSLPEALDTTGITSLNVKDAWKNTNIYFLSALLSFRIDEKERAVGYVRKAIEITTDDNIIKLYKCCIDLICANKNCEIIRIVESMYDKQICKFAYNLLYSDRWLSYFNFTSCFDCKNCRIKEYCFFLPYIKLLRQIEEEYENNIPNQADLQTVLS